jgi:hypothetical protein
LVLLSAAPSSAGAPTDNPEARPPSSMPLPSGGADDAKPADDGQSKGAQVLPLAPPDASTARGQERGNAALRAGQNPRQGGGDESEGKSGPEK